MSTLSQSAERFVVSVAPGQRWEAWRPYCHPDATFRKVGTSSVGMEVHDSLREFAESTKAMVAVFPDLRVELRSLAVDEEHGIAMVYLVIEGTHTGEGGPVPPTGRSFEVDAAYVMEFDGDRLRHLTMVMNELVVDKRLGWA